MTPSTFAPSKSRQKLRTHEHGMVLELSVPEGMDPAIEGSLKRNLEKILELWALSEQPHLLKEADRIAELLGGKLVPDTGLISERLARLETIRTILETVEWLTAEQLNGLQARPPAQKSHPASDWKRRGRIFGVTYDGKEYFARYQFNEAYQPLPIIKEVLRAFGPVADAWKIAAWFHFPNGWLSKPDAAGLPHPLAPKDALDQPEALLRAVAARHGSYVA